MRRPDRALLLLLPPLLLFLVFGAARVDAPVSLIGLLFDRPAEFALAATVLVFGGAVLMFVRPIERRLSGVFAPSREPTPEERERLAPLLALLGQRSRIDTGRLILRIQSSDQLNAAAGAAHLLFISEGAMRRPDPELDALLAHELGHHRGLHPVVTAMVWWLSIVVIAWQLSVMWLYYVGKLLALRAARVSEYLADGAAADWGYARQLSNLYASLDEPPPRGLLARLTADHPPIEQRIERLAGR